MTQPETYNGVLQAKPEPPALQGGCDGFTIHGSPAAIWGALAKAQSGFGPIERSKRVTVKSDKGSYTFDYAPLETILAAVTPALNAAGLALIQPLVKEGPAWVLRTLLCHESGAYLECGLTLPPTDGWQKLGSAVTYARRYMVGALLGIAPEEDDDGTAAEDMPRETQQRGPRANTRPTPPQAQQKATPSKATAPAPVESPPAKGTDGAGPSGAVASGGDSSGDTRAATQDGATPSSPPSPKPVDALLKEIGDALRGGRLRIDEHGEVKWFTKAAADELAKATVGKAVTAIAKQDDALRFLAVLAGLPKPTPKQQESYLKLRAKFGKDREQADLFCADVIGHQSDWVPSEQECTELLEALNR